MFVVAVAVAGVFGVLLRWGIVSLWPESQFPWAVLCINVAGSTFMGVLAAGRPGWETMTPALAIGFLGALTTFSAYSLDVLRLFQEGQGVWAVGYVLGSNLLSIGGCYLGFRWAS